MIHRHTRSELEYAGKVLYPYANKQKQFKPNRKGYLLPKESKNHANWRATCWAPPTNRRRPTSIPLKPSLIAAAFAS